MNSRVTLIVGPTTSGKTRIAFGLAKRQDALIVPIDQLHMYKDLSVGTNLDATAISGAKTLGYQILNPWKRLPPNNYAIWLNRIIEKYHKVTSIVIEGGCTSYLKAFVESDWRGCASKLIDIYAINLRQSEFARHSAIYEYCDDARVELIILEVERLMEKGYITRQGEELFAECEQIYKHPEDLGKGLAWAVRISSGVYHPAYLALRGKITAVHARERITRNVLAIQDYQASRLERILPRNFFYPADELSDVLINNTKNNNAVNSDAFSVRAAHYKCAGYGCRWAGGP